MHKLKRGLALLMAAIMILGVAPKSARADGFDGEPAPTDEVVAEAKTSEEAAQEVEEAEVPTEAPAEALPAAPTEAQTQAPTEAPTQAPTTAPTEAPTEAKVEELPEAPAEKPEEPTKASAEEPAVMSGEDKLEEVETPVNTLPEVPAVAPTEAAAPAEVPTEAPTEAQTEAPTAAATPAPTEPPKALAAAPSKDEIYSGEEFLDLRALLQATRAADNSVKADHGAVKVYNYDYDKLITRLTSKYPGVFKTVNVYKTSDHSYLATTTANRALLTNATNHRQNSNSGTTAWYLNNTSRSTSNWGQGLGGFESREYFTVNGHRAYCFDWTTPSTTGSHVLSSSLSEAGINAQTGVNVTELAQVAKMLTENNYALIVQNADTIAKGLSIPAFTDPDRAWFSHAAVTVSKNDVATLLRDTTADGIAFKRAMVQMLVWQRMNKLSLSDWMYSFIADSGYYDKEGNWVDAGVPTLSGPIIGYAGIIDFNKMYNTGKTAWEQLTNSTSVDYEYQYQLTVGVPFSVPAADVVGVTKIVQANGNKIESSGTVTVNVTASGVTLTATQAIPNWTSWLTASESSNMIYSSKPYDASYSGHTGKGQFIVDVSEMKFMRARVKAEMPTGTVKITKSSANTTITNGNSCYSLAGAQYGIYTNSGCTTLAKDASGNNAILTTTATGASNTITINAGNYWIKEIKASPGYGLAAGTYAITVTNNGNISLSSANSNIFAEPPLNDPMSIIIQKTPATEYADANFDMSGAQYTIKYYAGQYTKDNLPTSPATTWVIETKKVGNNYVARLADGYVVSGSAVYGKNASGQYIIPLGTVTIQETKAPTGFKIEGSTLQLLNGNGSDASDGIYLFNLVDQNSAVSVVSGNVTDDSEDGAQILQKETVSSVNVKVQKTSDDGNVSGLSFTLSGTLLAGGTYSETKTTDANGAIDFGEVPYGSFTLTENLTEDQAKIYVANDPVNFTIDENTESPYTVNVHNTLMRGSMNFTKVLKSSGAALANVPFKLTNTDTNEAHYFITGADGTFNTERGTHSANTNGADQALSSYVPDTGIVPDSVIEDLVAAGAASYGVWFGPGTVNDTFKALPLGNYKLEEMKTEGRKSLVLVTVTFSVTEDGQAVDLGTIENEALEIGTVAKDSVTNTHNAFAGPNATIIDTITYSGCKVGETYTVNGELMLVNADGSVEALGETATGEFTAEAPSGSTTTRSSPSRRSVRLQRIPRPALAFPKLMDPLRSSTL